MSVFPKAPAVHSAFGVVFTIEVQTREDKGDIACDQALLFGQAKRASRERASKGPRKGELATISHKFSFPPRKPQDSAKRENCHRKRAACQVSLDSRGRVELFIYKSLSQQH